MRGERLQFGILAEEMLEIVGSILWSRASGTSHRRSRKSLQERMMRSRANSASQSPSPKHLMTFQLRRKERPKLRDDLTVSATGPSSRCRLQLMTKVTLSSLSRAASVSAAIDSGSSISPSPKTPRRGECRCSPGCDPSDSEEARLVDRTDRPDGHRHRRKLPERRHQPGCG